MHQKAVEALPGLNKLIEQIQSSPDTMETLAPFSSLAAPDTRIKFELPDKGANPNSTVVSRTWSPLNILSTNMPRSRFSLMAGRSSFSHHQTS